MTSIVYTSTSSSKLRKKRKPTAAQRELAAAEARMLEAHSKPLTSGRKYGGSTVVEDKMSSPVVAGPYIRPASVPKPPPAPVGVATKVVCDPLAAAKAGLASRVGQAYNKGGLSYLTDDELAEQRTGAHKRRT